MLIDSHVNLHAPQFADDREEVIARARAAGVGLMITICDKVSSFDQVRAIAETNPDIWCSVGTHPHESREDPDLTAERLVTLASHPRVVGIGETGLDFHYDFSPRDVQESVFRQHVAAARTTGLPLIVHTRQADDLMGDILEDETAKGAFPILMHCYTSGARLARRAADLGAWFSVSGIATFKSAREVREIVAEFPDERILLETDCPYLAPVPLRGRRCEPAHLPHVRDCLAGIKGWTAEETDQRTSEAFFNLFKVIPAP